MKSSVESHVLICVMTSLRLILLQSGHHHAPTPLSFFKACCRFLVSRLSSSIRYQHSQRSASSAGAPDVRVVPVARVRVPPTSDVRVTPIGLLLTGPSRTSSTGASRTSSARPVGVSEGVSRPASPTSLALSSLVMTSAGALGVMDRAVMSPRLPVQAPAVRQSGCADPRSAAGAAPQPSVRRPRAASRRRS